MRILHVVTLVTPDAVFGGPVRVAENLAAAQRARGDRVLITAGERGWAGAVPAELAGTVAELYPVRRLPFLGTSGMLAPTMLKRLPALVREQDLVHVHLARDLVTLPAALLAQRAGVPTVLQTHGMVTPSGHPLSGPLDALATRRVLRRAAAVLHLTELERTQLLEVVPDLTTLVPLANGTPVGAEPAPLPERPEVLFCARLHPRKRPLVFVRMAERLLADGADCSFVLVGPDDGEGGAVRAAVARVGDPERLRWEGPLAPDRVRQRLSRASLSVLPSIDEPFPMSVLESLAAGRACVVTDTCGLAETVREAGAGAVVDSGDESLRRAVAALLADPEQLARVGRAARAVAVDRLGMDAVAQRLDGIYAQVLAASGQTNSAQKNWTEPHFRRRKAR